MSVDEVAIRRRLLCADLSELLADSFSDCAFNLNVDEAMLRPGEAIDIAWSDGPSTACVAAALYPRWSPSGSGYPVTLNRSLSPTAVALLLLQARRAGDLPRLAALRRTEFSRQLEELSSKCSLPAAADPTDWACARVVSMFAEATLRRDFFMWVLWMHGDGAASVDAVLGTFSAPAGEPAIAPAAAFEH